MTEADMSLSIQAVLSLPNPQHYLSELPYMCKTRIGNCKVWLLFEIYRQSSLRQADKNWEIFLVNWSYQKQVTKNRLFSAAFSNWFFLCSVIFVLKLITINTLLSMLSFPIRAPAFKCQLTPNPRCLQVYTLGGSRWWLKWLSWCHLHGKPRLSFCLLASSRCRSS